MLSRQLEVAVNYQLIEIDRVLLGQVDLMAVPLPTRAAGNGGKYRKPPEGQRYLQSMCPGSQWAS